MQIGRPRPGRSRKPLERIVVDLNKVKLRTKLCKGLAKRGRVLWSPQRLMSVNSPPIDRASPGRRRARREAILSRAVSSAGNNRRLVRAVAHGPCRLRMSQHSCSRARSRSSRAEALANRPPASRPLRVGLALGRVRCRSPGAGRALTS